MSRFAIPAKNPNFTIAVGLDRPLQEWFFQLYGPDADGEPLFFVDTRSNSRICELIREHADMTDSKAKHVYECIMLDLDPAEDRPQPA